MGDALVGASVATNAAVHGAIGAALSAALGGIGLVKGTGKVVGTVVEKIGKTLDKAPPLTPVTGPKGAQYHPTGHVVQKLPVVDNMAHNAANAVRLKAELAFQEAGILGKDGRLTAQAIKNSEPLRLKDGVIKNPEIVKILTRDGSNIEDWQKFATPSVRLVNEQSTRIHFYKNIKTGAVYYLTKDYKIKGIVKP